jgi:hypothetical protein
MIKKNLSTTHQDKHQYPAMKVSPSIENTLVVRVIIKIIIAITILSNSDR